MIKNNVTNSLLGKIVVKNSNIYLIENDLGLQGELLAYKIGIPFTAIESSIDNELLSYVSEKISEKDIKLFNFNNNIFWNKDHYYVHPFSNGYIWHENYFSCHKALFDAKGPYVFKITIKDGVLEDIKLDLDSINNKSIIKNKMLQLSSISPTVNFDELEALFYKGIVFNNSFIEKLKLDKLKLKEVMREESFNRIVSVLDIVEFAVKKSNFVDVLGCLRNLRRSIEEYIFSDYFIPIYSEVHFKGEKHNDLSDEVKSLSNLFDFKDNQELFNHFSSVYQEYYKSPTYFSFTRFENLEVNKIDMGKDNLGIIKFIKKILLKNKDKINDWNKACDMVNRFVNQNDFSTGNFHPWYLNQTELDSLYKITSMFLDVVFLYEEWKNK